MLDRCLLIRKSLFANKVRFKLYFQVPSIMFKQSKLLITCRHLLQDDTCRRSKIFYQRTRGCHLFTL